MKEELFVTNRIFIESTLDKVCDMLVKSINTYNNMSENDGKLY